ncbi:MAG: hypothetical protein K6F00_08530 [Lachnospiraceae bacterium]|nr:hypothetical protein [Lachnospiraceae bacterium]
MAGIFGIAAYRNTVINREMNGTVHGLFSSGHDAGMYGNTAGRLMPVKDRSANSFATLQRPSQRGDTDERSSLSKQMRYLIRQLKETPKKDQNAYSSTSKDKMNGFLELSGSPESDKAEKSKKSVKYNYKEVATKIQRAKNSVSAGEAVISAKRNVLDIKRKIADGDGDPEELQLALTHAKRMEMAARKKKYHLELEELVVNTQRRDENRDKMEEAAGDMKNAIIAAEEEKLSERADEIFNEREEILHDALEEQKEKNKQITDEMMADLNSMIAQLGEDELKELEESMEMLDLMEVIDPHMSKEDLEELKRKHRAEENKAIMKADMDYLKGMIKHQLEKGASMPAGTAVNASGSVAPAVITAGADIAVPSSAGAETGSIDVQI